MQNVLLTSFLISDIANNDSSGAAAAAASSAATAAATQADKNEKEISYEWRVFD